VYNPVSGWASTVLEKTTELKEIFPNEEFEVIVVNDGSHSENFTGVKNQLDAGDIKLIEYLPNQGKGEAIRTGVKASSGDIVVYTDIDFPYTISSISSIIDILKAGGADVVIGVKDKSYYSHVPPMRRIISRFLRMLIRLFFRIPTDDTQCGLKGFNLAAKPIFLRTTIRRYLFDLEFVFLASRSDGIIVKIQPVQLCEGIQFRKMNLGIIKNELWNFFKIFFRALFA